jgi:pimeloyl-ACP methyl ester carboxylesterase
MPSVRIDNALLSYEVHGRGQPVVFVNGWGLTRGCWEPTVERLSGRYRCVVYDPRGVGRSDADDRSTFEPDEHADDLKAVCEAADAYDAHVVGHELGGRVATLAVRRHPQIAATLTIVGWWGAAQIQEAMGDFARFRKAASLLLQDLGTYPVLRNLVAWSYRRVAEPARTRLFEEFAALDAQTAYLTAVAAEDPAAAATFDDSVVRIRVPVLLIQGGDDREAARRGLRSVFRRLEHVDLATVHGSGPLPMLEHPDAFARTLAQFFAEHAP